MRASKLSAIALTGALLLAACGDTEPDAGAADTTTGAATDTTTDTTGTDDAGDTTTDTTGTDDAGDTAADDPTAEPADGEVTVATASTDLGTILVDGEGRTLYLFDNDSEGESACTDDCAQNWPPLTGTATVGGEADASLLGTTTRDDGSVQVTYAGHPLYYFAADAEPGDLNGQGVGDVWWVLAPDGTKITQAEAAADDGSASYGD